MAAEHQYFYEDEVFRINKKGNIEFGMVIETSELASGDENSDVEEGGRMKKDHIRVAWHPSGVEEVIPEKKVHLADRSLMPGDVVRRLIKGKDTQRGYCRDIKVQACVQIVGTKQVILDVKSEHLTPLEEFATDIVACLDSWVGSIKTVHSKVVLRCPDGSRCVTSDIEALGLEDFKERRDCVGQVYHESQLGRAANFCSACLPSHLPVDSTRGRNNECDFVDRRDEFYPGQILYGPLQVLEDAEWLHQTKEVKSLMGKSSKMAKVAVEEVRTDSVGIHWQCRAYSREGAGLDKEQPKFLLQGDDLKKLRLLNVFEPCTLQVGDRNFYTLREGDTITTREQWRSLQRDTLIALSLSNGIKVVSPKRARSKTSSSNDAARKSPPHAVSETINGQEVNMNTPEVTVTLANDDAEWDTEEGTGSMSDTASISSNCSSISSQGKKKKGPALMTKVLKKKKLRRTKKKAPALPLVPGFRVVVETLSTSSIADVVWQDGSVEIGIPSTHLYPIHHLDDQEFFPGDFVIENRDDSCMRVYGVVQSVDHAGRTARIKWFKTYTSQEEPQPGHLTENEVSVYDLKDHPDFQYRPGTVVIRVANFEGEDANCTAGQVLDNYPEGMVRVWWVDDHVSMCWPQDLYKVGEYDSDEGELWDDASSDGSWETESEDCFIADDVCMEEDVEKLLRPKLAANIEKARIAMSRLEEIFTQNPSLSTAGVMRQLLDVYKDCRYLDKLMGTSFFHESHFQGLLERVRERGRANVAQRVADQVSRLFCDSNQDFRTSSTVSDPGSAPEDSGLSSAEASTKDSNGSIGNDSFNSGAFFLSENLASLERRVTAASNSSKTDSVGLENSRTAGGVPNGDVENSEVTSPPITVSNSHVCVKLCSLIKAQLVKAHAEVTRRFGGHQGQMTLSEAFKTHSPVEEADEEKVAPAVSATSEETGGQTQPLLEKVKDGILDVFNVIVRLKTNAVPNGEDVAEEVKEDIAVSPPVAISEESSAVRECGEGFSILDSAPNSHKFKLTMFQPTDPQNFFKTVRKEIKLLNTSLPHGIWVKGFEDRMDLYSVMVRGPENTPYEDGLFFFDFQLSADYPKAPPLCHYISYCSDRLNPNLYEDGKVCVSLLGTWSGKGTEVWTSTSNLLQVIVSIQGLILVSEPYFNEAGYEKQKGSQQGKENSRMYNEMAVLKLVQAQTKLIITPPPIFEEEIMMHFRRNAYKMIEQLESWLEISERYNNAHPITPTSPTSFREMHGQAISEALNAQLPEFPLIPASKGFCLTLRKSLVTFRETLASVNITGPS